MLLHCCILTKWTLLFPFQRQRKMEVSEYFRKDERIRSFIFDWKQAYSNMSRTNQFSALSLKFMLVNFIIQSFILFREIQTYPLFIFFPICMKTIYILMLTLVRFCSSCFSWITMFVNVSATVTRHYLSKCLASVCNKQPVLHGNNVC